MCIALVKKKINKMHQRMVCILRSKALNVHMKRFKKVTLVLTKGNILITGDMHIVYLGE